MVPLHLVETRGSRRRVKEDTGGAHGIGITNENAVQDNDVQLHIEIWAPSEALQKDDRTALTARVHISTRWPRGNRKRI